MQRRLFSIRTYIQEQVLMHSLPDGGPIAAALLGVSLMTMGKFYAASPAAGFLMLPYLGWTCFATTLINCSLWDSNPAVVQSAHKVAQVRPQGPHEMSQARQLHKRNITCPADLGKINPSNAAHLPGSIQYSDRPILGRRSSGEHLSTQEWGGPPTQNMQPSHLHARQLQPPQQPWDVRAEYQPAMHTPFGEANLHRRSARESDRRTTRRTTDDHISSGRFVTHTDSGHLIIPQWSGDKPERRNSGLGGSGLFARVGLSLCTCASWQLDMQASCNGAGCDRHLLLCLQCGMQQCVAPHRLFHSVAIVCPWLADHVSGKQLHYCACCAKASSAGARLPVSGMACQPLQWLGSSCQYLVCLQCLCVVSRRGRVFMQNPVHICKA